MSDDSDDEFDMGFSGGGGRGKGKGKAKGKPAKRAVKKLVTPSYRIDDLIAESERDIKMNTTSTTILDLGDMFIAGELKTEELKARTEATVARDAADHMAIMSDTSLRVPGVIRVLRPPQVAPAELPFDVRCPRKELKVLYDALGRAATDPVDLEYLTGEVLVPWLRQNLGGKAPPELCRWLFRVVATHGLPMLVMAAEKALLELLAEKDNVWKLRHEDVQVMWSRCGPVWSTQRGGGGDGGGVRAMEEEEEEEEGEGSEEEDGDEDHTHLRRNLKPSLHVAKACLLRGAHEMSNDELREMLLDLAAALLDAGVTGSCQTEMHEVLEAVVDAMPTEYYEDPEAFFSLVDGLCDPSARALQSRMTRNTFVLLARNVPYMRKSGGGGGKGSSLRYEVCHRLLTERFLAETSYAGEGGSSEGLGRAVKALQVLLCNEDNLLHDDSAEGYERQYAVLAITNEMVGSMTVLTKGDCPDAKQSKELILLIDAILKKLTDVMQEYVQMSQTLLDLMKIKYSPRLASSSGRQCKISFGKTKSEGNGGGGAGGGAGRGGGEDCDDNDDDDGGSTDEFDQ